MLAVDKDIEASKREQAEWLKHGISTVFPYARIMWKAHYGIKQFWD